MKQVLDEKNFFASLEIGKVPLGGILNFNSRELIALYNIFFWDLFGAETLFSEKFLPKEQKHLDFLLCVPSKETLASTIVHSEISKLFKVGDYTLDNFDGRRQGMIGSYILRTSISAIPINSAKCVNRWKFQFMTLLEAEILWLFFRWLSGVRIVTLDLDSKIVTSSHDLNAAGALMIMDCSKLEIYSYNFIELVKLRNFRARKIMLGH